MGRDDLLPRLRQVLAGSGTTRPRPVADLGLPAAARHLVGTKALERLTPAAVLVPIMARGGSDLRVLLTVRSEKLRNHAGQISLPGGRSDPRDADAVATALRESREEVGLAPELVEVIGRLPDYPTVTGFCITPVVGVVDGAAAVAADGVEVVETFELPLELLADPSQYQQLWAEHDGLRLPYYVITHGTRRIWGATAGILQGLAQSLAHAG